MSIKVFLDTNIYQKYNFSFNNRQFMKLKELAKENYIELLYNEVVFREVEQHINDNVKKAAKSYNKMIFGRLFAPFRNDARWNKTLNRINKEDMAFFLHNLWIDLLDCSSSIKIPIDVVSVDKIVNDYFEKKSPFEEGKQFEFKDAICVESIKQFHNMNGSNISILTGDKGFKKSFEGEEGYNFYDDLESFLNYVISQDNHLVALVAEKYNDTEVIDVIKKKLENQLYLASIYVEDSYETKELESVRIDSVSFKYVDDIDNESALIVSSARVEIIVSYSVMDEDMSYYDKEEDRYYWMEFIDYKAKYSFDLDFLVSFYIEIDDEEIDVRVDVDEVDLEEAIFLKEEDKTDCVILNREEELIQSGSIRVCPDCGCVLTEENDMGAFCSKCAPNH